MHPTLIGFSTPNYFNPVSRLIRFITKSKASHAFVIYFAHDWNMDCVLEAHELGFRITPLERFIVKNNIVKVVVPRHPIDEGLLVIAKRYLGSMYDYKGLFGMSVVMLGRFLKRKWNNPFRGSKSVFCSESVIIAMKNSHGYEDLDLSDDTDPEALLEYFETKECAT
jgi:hypothetical protein